MSSFRSYTKLFTFSRGLRVAPCRSCSGAAPPRKNISPPPRVVPLSEVRRFITQCMVTVGTPQRHAKDLASLLADADYRGHYIHGLSRLEMYVNDVKLKRIDSGVKPKIIKSTSITAWVDGHNGLGVVVGKFCMKLAVQMAKKSGVGWVVAKNSNHFGLASWYTLKALDHQLLGLSFTNTSSVMCSKCGRTTTLASNPMSIAAPGTHGDSFILNMATTAMSLKKPDVKNQKDLNIQKDIQNQKDVRNQKDVKNQKDLNIQKDIKNQKDVRNQKDVNNQEDAPKQPEEKWLAGLKEMGADVSYETACLLPAVGPEGPMGYTGYGLGLVVETFCGILAGSNYCNNTKQNPPYGPNPQVSLSCYTGLPMTGRSGFESQSGVLVMSSSKIVFYSSSTQMQMPTTASKRPQRDRRRSTWASVSLQLTPPTSPQGSRNV